MAEPMTATRIHPLAGQVHAVSGVAITPAPEAFRISLRAPARSVGPLGAALGIELPEAVGQSQTAGNRMALCLGPDEWLVIDTKVHPAGDLAGIDVLHSAVDVSQRNTAILVSGPAAADLINAGCPRDLSAEAFPVGACARTLFGKVEVVLMRPKVTVFRMEVWRSFSPYAFQLLAEAARDHA